MASEIVFCYDSHQVVNSNLNPMIIAIKSIVA